MIGGHTYAEVAVAAGLGLLAAFWGGWAVVGPLLDALAEWLDLDD
jgi:hypothetical protein